MRIRRTIPPTATPIKPIDLIHGFVGLLSGGKKYRKQLERDVREHFGVKHAFFVSSGKAALAFILLALQDLSKKKQVVIPAYTCFSVASSVVKTGLEIVPCDIDPLTFDFDYDSLKAKLTNETLCIIATHLFGIPADLDRLKKLCAEKGVFVVEDAAQAMGGEHKGRKLGTIGDVGFYSLGRGKNITCGSGGIIVTSSDVIATAVVRLYANLEEISFAEDLKNFLQLCLISLFIRPYLYWLPTGMPFLKLGQTFFYKDFPMRKLSARRATLVQNWRDRLAESNQARTEVALDFFKNISMNNVAELCIPYLRFPILVQDRTRRDQIYARSKEQGLGISLMYPTAVDEIAEIKAMFHGETFPMAKKVAETLVTLPTHYLLTDKDKKVICDLFNRITVPEVQQTAFSTSEVV
jgi:dTDP-4-amino-4,6-dideoxygalactose transaminase